MAHVETLTTEARDHATVSTVDIRSDSLYATVYSVATGRPLGTIFAPFPGYPHYRKDWQAFNLKGEQLPGLVVGPVQNLQRPGENRWLTRHFERGGGPAFPRG
mgnify:CR=1 FL=1